MKKFSRWRLELKEGFKILELEEGTLQYRFLHSEIPKNRFLKQKIFFKIKTFGAQNQHWASLGQENTYISHDSTCGMDL